MKMYLRSWSCLARYPLYEFLVVELQIFLIFIHAGFRILALLRLAELAPLDILDVVFKLLLVELNILLVGSIVLLGSFHPSFYHHDQSGYQKQPQQAPQRYQRQLDGVLSVEFLQGIQGEHAAGQLMLEYKVREYIRQRSIHIY